MYAVTVGLIAGVTYIAFRPAANSNRIDKLETKVDTEIGSGSRRWTVIQQMKTDQALNEKEHETELSKINTDVEHIIKDIDRHEGDINRLEALHIKE